MKIIQTDLPDCLLLEQDVHEDERGFFMESWNAGCFARHGLPDAFVQHNVSRSRRAVLRGLHYQWPGAAQGKLVEVLEGEIFDVAVDLRRGSPGFGRHLAVRLRAGGGRQLWIPEGFAHGFLTLGEFALVSYLCTAPYDAASDRALRWNDARLAIDWPLREVNLSARDAAAPLLDDVPEGDLPVWRP